MTNDTSLNNGWTWVDADLDKIYGYKLPVCYVSKLPPIYIQPNNGFYQPTSYLQRLSSMAYKYSRRESIYK